MNCVQILVPFLLMWMFSNGIFDDDGLDEEQELRALLKPEGASKEDNQDVQKIQENDKDKDL